MRPGLRRVGALLGCTLITVLTPVLPVLPAAAQEQPNTVAKPPPLPPDFPVPTGTAPDLPYVNETACIGSLGKAIDLKNKPWGQIQLRFDELHKFVTGKDVKIAVIDTGVAQHPYLGSRLLAGGDYVKAEDRGISDCDGHGTEVAGIIAANPPKELDIGFKGIAPDSIILSIRQSSRNFVGMRPSPNNPNGEKKPAGTLITLAQAVVSATDQKARVINMSVDSCRPFSKGDTIRPDEQALQAALKYAFDRGVVLVASAGNTNENGCPDARNGNDPNRPTHIVTPPWFSDYVISVAAMDRNGDPASFSVQGPWVSVAAPGTEIISLDPASSGLANLQVLPDGKGTQSAIQGTSFAAPYVAGLAALIIERFPSLTAQQIMDRIKITASHPAATGGRDNQVGYGMINPFGALTAMIPAEQNVPKDQAINITATMPPERVRDWTPEVVALVGAGGGVLALLITMFVMHTIRRNRRNSDLAGSAR